MAGSEKCFICDENICSDDIVEVKEKGIITLKKASVERKDNKHLVLEGVRTVKVHVICRKNYTRSDSIRAALAKKDLTDATTSSCTPERTESLRSSLPIFDFKGKCFYCAENIDEAFYAKEKKQPIAKRRKVYNVRSIALREKVIEAANKRNDKWGGEVKHRVMNTVDLVASDAIYHQSCFVAFFLHSTATGTKRGRPEVEDVTTAMEKMYSYLDDHEDCQVSLSELMSQCTEYVPNELTVKSRLKQKYGDRIIITQNQKKVPIVCFRDTGMKILTDSWYKKKKTDEREERLRIVQTAAAIIKEDIQSKVYENSAYPSTDDFFSNASTDIPETLRAFVDHVVVHKKDRNNTNTKRKSIAIAHAIISAVRPRSFLSSLQISLAVFLYRKYGSKNLVTLVSNLGFCSSYHDAQIFETSAIYHPAPELLPGAFCQFVFDNADFNVSTIDGLNTFHSMGGIKCVTPTTSLITGQEIQKLTKPPSTKEIGKLGVIPLQTFENVGGNCLKNITIEDLSGLRPLEEEVPSPQLHDILWMCGKFLDIPFIPEWKGFMHSVSQNLPCKVTKVIPLPFVNSPPSNYDTVYTVLNYAADECLRLKQRTCFITFDQPLYIKAREIVAASSKDSCLSNIVVRLGGFHLLLSYLGCIGYIMAGSGLKEILSTIYAPNSAEKMMQGHAYARAVRAHLLIQTALAKIIFENLGITIEEQESFKEILRDFVIDPPTLDNISQNDILIEVKRRVQEKLQELKKNGATASLWVQYFEMVTLMKEYIDAERSGDWNKHLRSVQQMIPFFHASGHLLYAKSCHLYLQDMFKLQSSMTTVEFEKFVHEGYFTMRRTDSFWAGVWSDMTIEQTLMRSMKSSGGLTRGRGITDSVLSKWILGTAATLNVCASLEDFCGMVFTTGEQHVDFQESRIQRNAKDTKKISDWFSNHPPFPVLKDIMSLATGLIGGTTVNCYKAIEVGKIAMEKMIGNNFFEVKLSRKDKVLSLATVNSAVKIHGEIVPLDPLMIFQRIAISKKTEELKDHLEYELAPYPLSLFNEAGMRKTKKSAMYEIFPLSNEDITLQDCVNIVDGGFLLHRVIWKPNSTYSSLCASYITYIQRHYGKNCTVVFDGYSNTNNSTKKTEQNRRSAAKKSMDINFDESMSITVRQDQFLSNDKNKSRLIDMLSTKLNDQGIGCRQSTDDADSLIVNTAIQLSLSKSNVAIIGEDVDLLVLLVALAPSEKNIFFVKPGKGKIARRVYSSQQSQSSGLANNILFLHAFSGCDTTSAIFKKGKVRCVKLFNKSQELHDIAESFNNRDSSHDVIAEAGERFFLAIYGARSTDNSLNKHRYHCFTKSVTKIKPDIASLPPTEGASRQHSFRVYNQVQKWLGNELPPELWGWKRVQGYFSPITTMDSIAPEALLNLIFCKCRTGCAGLCGCRKAGIDCTTVCNNCHGDCFNGPKIVDEENEDEDEVDNANEERAVSTNSSRRSSYAGSIDLSDYADVVDDNSPSTSQTAKKRRTQT